MKKRTQMVLAAVLTAMVTIQVYANSAPVRMYGYPSSAIMSIEESSPIEVEREELSFDLSGESAYRGKVTASYTMHNTEAASVTSRMAFPYIGTLWELAEEETVVRVDGEEVPYTVYIGDAITGDTMKEREEEVEAFDMKKVMGSLSAEAYEPRNFDRKATGKTYRVMAAPTGEEDLSLTLRFTMVEEKTRVVANGFNGYGRNGNRVELTGWVDREAVFELHVQGEDIEIEVEGFTIEGGMTARTEAFTYRVTDEEETFEEFLAGLRGSLRVQTANLHPEGRDNLYLRALDDGFESMQGVATGEELQVADSQERYLLLLYEVPFEAGGRRSVEVGYTAQATVDRSVTPLPTYTFTYLLSPAAYWKDFRNLTVEVRTGEHAPYLIGSSMDMAAVGDRIYKADMDQLPEGDLTFTLYHKPEITTQDRIQGTLRSRLGYAYPLVLTMLFLLVATVLLLGILIHRQKRRESA